jgi:hypothetical protein
MVLVERTLAGGKGKRQLQSARRQTTIPSDVGYRILKVAKVIAFPTTCLQATGPAASAQRDRTHALGLSVCMCLQVVCHALAVAGVNRRPCGLFPALLQMSCMCETRT